MLNKRFWLDLKSIATVVNMQWSTVKVDHSKPLNYAAIMVTNNAVLYILT